MFWAGKWDTPLINLLQTLKSRKGFWTRQENLTMEHIKELYQYKCSSEYKEKSKDVFVFQCLTGLRYVGLELVNKRILTSEGCLYLEENNDHSKPASEIPLYKIQKRFWRNMIISYP